MCRILCRRLLKASLLVRCSLISMSEVSVCLIQASYTEFAAHRPANQYEPYTVRFSFFSCQSFSSGTSRKPHWAHYFLNSCRIQCRVSCLWDPEGAAKHQYSRFVVVILLCQQISNISQIGKPAFGEARKSTKPDPIAGLLLIAATNMKMLLRACVRTYAYFFALFFALITHARTRIPSLAPDLRRYSRCSPLRSQIFSHLSRSRGCARRDRSRSCDRDRSRSYDRDRSRSCARDRSRSCDRDRSRSSGR